MPHTTPDYGNANQVNAQPDIDNTELAARIDYPAFFRSGRVIFFDKFEYISQWNPGAHVYLTTAAPYYETSAYIALVTNDTANIGSIFKQFPLVIFNKVGIEFALSVYPLGDVNGTQLNIILEIGKGLGYSFQFWLQIILQGSPNPAKLYYESSVVYNTPIFTQFGTFRVSNGWLVFKLVLDIANEKYGKLLINNTVFDLSTITPAYFSSNPTITYSTVTFKGDASGINNPSQFYIGYIILTGDEP